jgi:hypothetical protein
MHMKWSVLCVKTWHDEGNRRSRRRRRNKYNLLTVTWDRDGGGRGCKAMIEMTNISNHLLKPHLTN